MKHRVDLGEVKQVCAQPARVFDSAWEYAILGAVFFSMCRAIICFPLLFGLAFGSNLSRLAAREPVAPLSGVEVNGQLYFWDDIGRFIMPGETLRLNLTGNKESSGWLASAGELLEQDGGTVWVAPNVPGLYSLLATVGAAVKRINAFVMVPMERVKNGVLNGFSIGKYERTPPFSKFAKPRGFIEVTADNAGTPVSPRYTLGDFAPNAEAGYPKYMLLREELLIKLELLTDLVRTKVKGLERLCIMSGYRTPAGHRPGRSSAHYYGGAADVYVDTNHDGTMDDLNHDGRSTSADSRLLASWVDELESAHPELVGGCGWYRRTGARGPFVHIDIRGDPMRWHQ